MDARLLTTGIGGLIAVFGLFGLFFAGGVMDIVGFAPDKATPAQALGETRAIYGGMMLAMGIYTVLAGLDLDRNRRVVFFVALLFAGAAVGRVIGFLFDGFPGLFGAFSILFNIGAAAILGWASQITPDAPSGA